MSEPVAVRVQFLRGTHEMNSTYTGRAGEITLNHHDGRIHIHNGSKAGGFVVLGEDDVYTRAQIDALLANINDKINEIKDTLIPNANTAINGVNARIDGLTKDHIGLNQVDNTSDMDKPVSNPQQAALDDKMDKDDNLFDFGTL